MNGYMYMCDTLTQVSRVAFWLKILSSICLCVFDYVSLIWAWSLFYKTPGPYLLYIIVSQMRSSCSILHLIILSLVLVPFSKLIEKITLRHFVVVVANSPEVVSHQDFVGGSHFLWWRHAGGDESGGECRRALRNLSLSLCLSVSLSLSLCCKTIKLSYHPVSQINDRIYLCMIEVLSIPLIAISGSYYFTIDNYTGMHVYLRSSACQQT